MRRIAWTGVAVLAASALLATAAVAAPRSSPAGPHAAPAGVLPMPGTLAAAATAARAGAGTPAGTPVSGPLPPSACQALDGAPCFDAQLLRHIYGLDGVLARDGINGRGRTVALILPYRNPVLRHDLDVYALAAGLPVPDLKIIRRGHPAVADPASPAQADAVQEGTLDSEMILTTAPGVRLVYVEAPGWTDGPPPTFRASLSILTWLRRQGIRVDVSSWSEGWFEANYAELTGTRAKAAAMIRRQGRPVAAAVRAGVTVVSADGDTGPTGPDLTGTGVYPDPTVAFAASDPLVTAVSGSQLHAGDQGARTAPDSTWTDDGDGTATGGGRSAVFARPRYQDQDAAVTGAHRGVGDIAMDGSLQSPVWMYTSRYQILPGQAPGWVQVAGTSAAAPLFAGIVADAAQEAGHPLGNIGPRLYAMSRHDARNGIADITAGCNTADGVPGFCARPGYDLASGIGTVGSAARFVPALAGRH
jgi:subtilase family serine protease